MKVEELIDTLKRFPAGAEVRALNEDGYYAPDPVAFQRVDVDRPFTPPGDRAPESEEERTVYITGTTPA